ncbi:MAG: protein kinase domain-containing protein [Nannocystales bacterium]
MNDQRTVPAEGTGDTTLGAGIRTDQASQTPVMAGRYRVLRTLGRGGMGIVYLAYDPQLDRELALKLCFDASETTVVRHRREAKALAALHHPNVLEIYDVGEHDGLLYIAMEVVDGGTAKRRFGSGALRPWREVLKFYLGAAAGLSAAHRADIIHRDFKPENVLVTREGEAKVADFGLAIRDGSTRSAEASGDVSNSEDRVTRAGAAVGTPAFMAPEQLLGLDLDARADQYSFCATLFEGLFGKRPYLALNAHARLATLALAKIAWPRNTRGVPKHILWALERGLSTDPSQRFESMTALVEALTATPRRRWPVVALSLGLVGTAGLVAVARDTPSSCDLEPHIGWTAQNKLEVKGALGALDRLSSRKIVQDLDQFANAWDSQRDAYCGAGEAPQGEPATATCLTRLRDGFHARVDLLRDGDPDVTRKAPALIANLPPPDTCLDSTDGHLTPEQQEVLALLEAATAHINVGKYLESDALATRASSLALRLGQPTLLARTLLARADIVGERGNVELALELREQAYFVATANGLEMLAINTAQQIAPTHAQLRHEEQAVRWLEIVETQAKRATNTEVPAHMIAMVKARTYLHLGRYKDAHREADAALTELPATDGSLQYPRYAVISTLAAVMMHEGAPTQERAPVTEERVELALALYGPMHPDVAIAYEDKATILRESGKHAEAIELLQRARAIHIEAMGPSNLRLIEIDNKLSTNYQAQGDLDGAEASLRRALKMQSIQRTNDSASQINLESNLGSLLQRRGKTEEALSHQERALTLSETAYGTDGLKTALVRVNLADALGNLDDTKRPIAMLEAASEVIGKTFSPKHPAVGMTTLSLALAYIRGERLDDAQAALDNARSQLAQDPTSMGHLAGVSAKLLEARGATQQALDTHVECAELLSADPGYVERLKCLERASDLLVQARRDGEAYSLLQPELGAIRASTGDPRVRAKLLETLARTEPDSSAAHGLAVEALALTDGTSGGAVEALRTRLEQRVGERAP